MYSSLTKILKGQEKMRERERESDKISVKKSTKLALILVAYNITLNNIVKAWYNALVTFEVFKRYV